MDQITYLDDDGNPVTFTGHIDSAGNKIQEMTPDDAIEWLMDLRPSYDLLGPEARGVIYLIMKLREAGHALNSRGQPGRS